MAVKFVLLAVATFGFAMAGNIPDYIHICHRSDPEVSKCIREAIEVLRPKLKTGIPEIGVPGIEPFKIDEIQIIGGNSNSKASLKNIEVSGTGDFEITKLKLDIPKMTYRVGVKFPALHLKGEYDINVRVLLAPLKGNGNFEATATDCVGQGLLRADLKDNKLIFTKFDFLVKIGDYTVKLDNLFNGDQTLTETANELLNGNKQDFIPLIEPFIQRKVSEILLDVANKITQNFDYDEVFPEK